MICLVTDRRRMSAGPEAADRLVGLVTAAARAGVDLIQVRERDLSARGLSVLVQRCLAAVEGTAAKVVVNDRADVALAAGAHGVHLRGDSLPARAVRSLLPAGAVIGRSVHSVEEAASAIHEGGVDYLIFGTLFETPSKAPGHCLSTLEELTAVSRAAAAASVPAVPVLAIGGVTVERAQAVTRAGASGIAGIGLFVPPAGADVEDHVQAVVARLRRAFDTCEAVP